MLFEDFPSCIRSEFPAALTVMLSHVSYNGQHSCSEKEHEKKDKHSITMENAF